MARDVSVRITKIQALIDALIGQLERASKSGDGLTEADARTLVQLAKYYEPDETPDGDPDLDGLDLEKLKELARKS